MYVLGRRLGLGFAAALIAGIVFAFSPARFFRFAQTHLTTIQWMPFALAALIAYLDGAGPAAPVARDRAVHAAGADEWSRRGLPADCRGAAVLCRLMSGTPLAPLQRLRDIGLPGLVLLLPTVWMMPPYFRVQQELGLRRSLENWAPAAISFLASPSTLHAWILSKVTATPINTAASAFMFPGYAPILLTAASLLPGHPTIKRRDVVFFVVLTVLAVLLSAGPPLGLWPYVYWLPGFNFIRIPSRFILLAMMGIAVLAGIGFDRLVGRMHAAASGHRRCGGRRRSSSRSSRWCRSPCSRIRWRSRRSIGGSIRSRNPFAIAEVPVRPLVRYHSTYMLHSMAHWQRTVHGHSSLLTPLHEQLYDQLRTFPDAASVAHLKSLGVTYVVVHRDWYEPGEWPDVERRLGEHACDLTLVHEEAGGRIYRLAVFRPPPP